MESPVSAAPPITPTGPALSVLQRAGAIYSSPTRAWGGLTERSQWWFPMLVVPLVSTLLVGVIYHRAMLPMITSQWDARVESGEMSPEAYNQALAFMSGPIGITFFAVQQFIMSVILQLLMALAIWFGCSFVLGKPMKYRWSLEVASWSSLVTLPALALTGVIAWIKEDWQAAHVGFGILLPQGDQPTKLMTALGVMLDGIGPLALWFVAVLVIGAATLSGAPRRTVAWVIGGLYLLMLAFGAALASLPVRASS